MAKKQTRARGRRSDPKGNRTEAYRLIAQQHPDAKTDEIIRLVKERYGHDLTPTFVYLAKSKEKRKRKGRSSSDDSVAIDPRIAGLPTADERATAAEAAARAASDPAIRVMKMANDPAYAAIVAARTLLKIAGSREMAIEYLKAAE